MEAWLRGEEIQYAHHCTGKNPTWRSIKEEPIWDFAQLSYRIKPAPKSIWKLERPSGTPSDGTWDSRDKAVKARDAFYGNDIKVVEYREVIEEE